jgi:DNA modification methylase
MRPYYEDTAAGITIYCGDCRDVLPTLEAGSVDLVLTDPPYPGYEKGWDVPDVGTIIGSITADTKVVFWPPLVPLPLPFPVAEHVWHKPNGCSAHHYERILAYGKGPQGCKVFRVAAILPNYVQFRDECVNHPTQKPMQLMMYLLARYRGTSLLDPFMGSGTTLVAAKELGRRAIGIEIEEKYAEIAARRLQQSVLPLAVSS